MRKQFFSVLFFVGLIFVVLFFSWSKLIWVSFLLLFFLDSFTVQFIANILKNKLPKSLYAVVRYCFIILSPIFFAVFLRTFFVDVYYVPSGSMEKTIFPGDYVLVNKIAYGVKIPTHFRDVPVIGNLFSAPKNNFNLYTPLPAFKQFKRKDIVVFKAVDGEDKFLIKRIIGTPSDTLQIKASKVFINTKQLEEEPTITYRYLQVKETGILIIKEYSNAAYNKLSDSEKKVLKKELKEKTSYNYFLFPTNKQESWTIDNYGTLVIPKKGMKITLTKENIAIYNSITTKFEQTDLTSYKKHFYTFKHNYYFMMGDNRHNSLDSRSFGFVPQSYIQGKMVSVF